MIVSGLVEERISGFSTIMKKPSIGILSVIFLFIFSVLIIYQSPSVNQSLRSSAQVNGRRDSCLSRNQSVLYRRSSAHKPSSSYLQSRLRRYELLHKQCGPHTNPYNKSIENLKSGKHIGTEGVCNYVVWIPLSGLGNKIISLASAFLYALLTNRVLLIDPGKDMDDLFCEPFPETSWLLPLDFPLQRRFNRNTPQNYGNLLKINGSDPQSLRQLPFMYLYLVHDYSKEDKLFFCDEEQIYLQKVPWLILTSNTYFAPSFFLMSSFEPELSKLFPESKDQVFHHLGRYLFHPSNAVWDLITNYYGAHLANADERLGIQIRVFDHRRPVQSVYDQIASCLLKENLLPGVNRQRPLVTNLLEDHRNKSKAVLLTSLSSNYLEMLRKMYSEKSTVTGEVIRFYQPSHEERQQTDKATHDRKALAEMYLLSSTDVLITSAKSTFGYVAQGLGGVKPWILYKPKNDAVPDPPCGRAMSIEPCFQAPPSHGCKANTRIDPGALFPHVKHCEDMEMKWGLKLIEPNQL